MANVFDYLFNIGGNFQERITDMTYATEQFTGEIERI